MKIHHLNCISTCPLGGALMDGFPVGLVSPDFRESMTAIHQIRDPGSTSATRRTRQLHG